MVKITKNLFCFVLVVLLGTKMQAQMNGVYTVPGSFASLAAAVSSLNITGVSGAVTINIAAGYTETAPTGGYSLTATGTAASPIVFRKNGAGANPVLTAFTGIASPASPVQDGVWRLIGSDFITIDGIDITDPNTSSPGTMEYGYGLFKASATNGCQNNTIQNCVITLNRLNNANATAPAVEGSRAVNVMNTLATTQTSNLTVTAAAGSNSNNRFYANTLQNCNIGIALIGFADVSPFTLADTGNDIGGASAATGNTILNFGGAPGATNPAAAVRTLAQYNINVSWNVINNNNGAGFNHATTIRGIYLNTATGANASVLNNTLTLVANAPAAQVSGIETALGTPAANNTVTVKNNALVNCTNTGNTTSSFFGIYNNASAAAYLDISSNTFSNIVTAATTGNNYLAYNTGVIGTAISFNNNSVSSCSNTASTSGNYYALFNNVASSATLSANSNTFSGIVASAATGNIQFIFNASATAGNISMTANSIDNCRSTISSTGIFYALYNAGSSSGSLDMGSNAFTNSSVSGSGGNAHLVYNSAAVTNAVNMSNISVLSCTNTISAAGSFYAIYNNTGPTQSLTVSNNTFSNNTSSAATGSVHLIYNRGTAANVFNTITIDNNLVTGCINSASGAAAYLTLFNNGVTATGVSMSNNTVTATSWSTSTSLRYLIANTASVSSGAIALNNNVLTALTNSVNTTGVFYGIYNTGMSSSDLSVVGNICNGNTFASTTGATNLMYNAGLITNAVNITNNLIANCTNSATTSADFYGIFNNGSVSSVINITNNTFTNTILASSTGATNLIFNTGVVASSVNNINMTNNLIANCSNTVNSTGSFFGIYNSGASAANLSMSNNTFTNNTSVGATGTTFLIYNRGALTNTFTTLSFTNNLITAHTNSATGAAAFYNIYNNTVSSGNLSITGNTITNVTWATTTSVRYLVANSGTVSTGGITISGNIFTNLSNTVNTTGSFFGINTTGNCTGDLSMSNNTLTNISSSATSGTTNLLSNSGSISNSVSIVSNLFSAINNTATTGGDFYGIYNSGSASATVNISGTTFTNNTINSSAGTVYLITNTGAVASTINLINLSNNLVSACTNSISGAGSFFAVYNNGVSAANLVMSNNTFTNCVSTASTGATHLVYNRGAATNTFNIISITNNLITTYTNVSAFNGPFYSIFNNGVTSASLNISVNTVTSVVWNTVASTRYLINNTGIVNVSSTISNNIFSGLSNTVNTTGNFYGINNGAASTASAALTITNNVFTNNVLAGTTGTVQLITSTGVINNTISITNNFISSYTSSITTGGFFYGIVNGSASNGSLNISSNTFTNVFSTTASGSTYLIYNVNAITNGIALKANSITNFTNTATSGSCFFVYNTGASATMDASTNILAGIVFSTTTGSHYMIYNSGAMGVSNTYTGNLIANINNLLNTTGNTFGVVNSVGAASAGSLAITSNTITNNVLNGTGGQVQLIASSGVINNTISITNNYIVNSAVSLTTTGIFFGIYNGSASNANLEISSNTFTNNSSSATTGATYLMYNTGAVTNGVVFKLNTVSDFTNSATSGAFYGAYNNAAAASLDVSSNTFTNITFATTASNRYMLYNTGVISTSNTFTNNVVSNLTNTLNTTGIFYGIAHAAGTSTGSLTIANNIFTNNALMATGGGVQLMSTSGAINNTITMVNNLVSNYTSSISAAGNFIMLTNGSASNANLIMANNTFTNITSSIGSGGNYYVYNTGPATNSISLTNNLIASCTNTANAGGTFYGVYNNAASSGNLDMSVNTFTNNYAASTSGSAFFIYNRGAATNTFNTVSISSNLITASTQTATSGSVFHVYNSGVTAGNLSVTTNTVINNTWNTLTANRYVVYNGGPVTNAVSIKNNLIANGTNTANTSGIFYGLLNGATAANLDVSTNTITNISSSASTGTMHLVYNLSAITNSNTISGNLFSNCVNTATGTAAFYGIYNTATNSSGLNISSNTFTNNTSSTTSGVTAMIFNTGAANNTITAITITNNVMAGVTNSASAGGTFYGIFNNVISSNNLTIANNILLNHICLTTISARYGIYNTGQVTNTLSVASNTMANGNYVNGSTGAFYGIFNNAVSPGFLSIDNNSFSNNGIGSTTGPGYMILNNAAITGSTAITNNAISGTTFSTSISGIFYAINNLAASAQAININNNTIANCAINTNTVAGYMIYNTGVAANMVNTISIAGNTVSNSINTISTTAAFYGIYNNLVSSANLSITGNAFRTHTLATTTSPRYIIYNTGSVTTSASLSNNTVAGCNYTANTTAPFYGIYNTAVCTQGMALSNNTFSNTATAATTGTTYLVYNTGATSATVNMNNNLVTGYTHTSGSTAGFYGIYNVGVTSAALNMSGNTFSNSAVSTVSVSPYLVYSTGVATATITNINLNTNTVASFTGVSTFAPFYGVYNTGILSANLQMNGNAFNGAKLSANPGDMFLVYNNTAVTNTIAMNNNSIANGVYTSSLSPAFYGIYNSGAAANISVNTNTYSSNSWSLTSGNTYLLYNTGAASSSISISTNVIAGSTASTSGTGAFYSVYNNNAVAPNLNMNGNTFTNNASDINSGNTTLIYNTGNIPGRINMQNNSLGYTFNNATTPYIGTAYGICNTGGTTSTSLTVSGNNFSNYLFPAATGLGPLYFIYNSNNNASFSINNNVWSGLSVNNSGGHYLMYNASSTQSLLSVTNNSVVSYNRAGATAGNMYGYYSTSSAPVGGSQIFSGNNFSNITATVGGVGTFYGIYSADGTATAMALKTMSNNVISNISYNSTSNFIGLYMDYFGDASSIGSSVYNNTVTTINWTGGIYGLYTGQHALQNVAPLLYANVVSSLTSSGASSAIFPVLLGGGGAGLNFSKNRISDITQTGVTGVAYGIYVGDAVNTTLSNNTVGNINAPNSSAPNAVNGLYVAAGSTVNAYYNTVVLNATGTGANFSSNAIFASTAPSLTLRNNIFINNSVANGSGIAAAFKRSSASLASYASASDRNLFYAGNPGPSHVIYTDGVTMYQALPVLQAAIAPRDANSVTENTAFLSTVGNNVNFLHIDPTLPSLTESNAANIAGITDDLDAQVRQGNSGYAGTGTAPDIGADEYNQNLPNCSSANAGTISPASSVICGADAVTLRSAGYTYTAAGGIVHQWKIATAAGGPYNNVTGGGGANTVGYTSGTLAPGTYYYELVTTCTITLNSSTSNQASVTVNPLPTAVISIPVSTLCSGETLTLNGSSNTATSTVWHGPNNYTSAILNPVINNAGTNASGTYSLLVSNGTCTNQAASVPVLVNATPPPFVLTPSLTGICAGSSQTISASAAVNSPTLSFGTQSSQNSATGYPSPYSVYYGGQKMQMLVRASELSAAGFINGSPLVSLEFPVAALGGNWGTTLNSCENFRVNIGHTALTALSTFQTGLTSVLITPNFTPTVGYANTHTFSSPFIWDGVSNVVLETSFSNNITGTPGNAVFSYNSPASFPSTLVYRADNLTAAAVAAATTTNINVGVARPDFRLNGLSVGSYSWNPSAGLSSSMTQSVIASPAAATNYTVTLFNSVCSSSAVSSLSLVPMPTVGIVTTNSVLCAGNPATLTASGANSYTWNVGSNNPSITVAPQGSTTYSVAGRNFPCPAVSAVITLTVSPAVALVAIASSSTVCLGDSIILNATGATSYTWSTGATTASVVVIPTGDMTYTVTGSTGVGCSARKTVAITSSSVPVIVVSPSTQTTCPSKEVNFTASGANTYVWQPGGLNLPTFTDYPTVTRTYTVIGRAANTCTAATAVTAVVDPCTGISKLTNAQTGISVFPNPSTGNITVNFDFEGLKEVQLSGALGNLLSTTITRAGSESFDLSGFAKGVYFIKVISKEASGTYRIVLTD